MWPDKETNIDYLNFGYMVDMVADIDKNDKFLKYVKGIVKEYQQRQGRREE